MRGKAAFGARRSPPRSGGGPAGGEAAFGFIVCWFCYVLILLCVAIVVYCYCYVLVLLRIGIVAYPYICLSGWLRFSDLMLFPQKLQKAITAFCHISPGSFKIACVPWVCHVPGFMAERIPAKRV